MIAGCTTAEKSNQISTTVESIGSDQYNVGFKISHVGEDGNPVVLTTPRLILKAGQKGEVSVHDEENNDIICTAFVTKTEHGLEALTTVTITKENKETQNTTVTEITRRQLME